MSTNSSIFKSISNIQTNTINAATTNSNSNNPSPIISSHYSNDRMAMSSQQHMSVPSGVMMKDNDSKTAAFTPFDTSSNGVNTSSDTDIDIDLQGIPSFILDLQHSQPTLNIMTCGDVSHGKSTLLSALSGEKTGKHSQEVKGNMTIRLGYTSCKIWKCLHCPSPNCYFATHSDTALKKVQCHCGNKPNKTHFQYHKGSSPVILIRHLSFVDVPGHAHLMQTMVSATSVADGAILVIDSSKSCPGKQTSQHMDAINLLGLMRENQLIIAQNKIDLISPSKACLSYQEIRAYLHSFGNDALTYNTPIIPISAQSKLNIDALCHCIINKLPRFSAKLGGNVWQSEGKSLQSADLYMNIIRSFDVNRAKDLRTMRDIDGIVGGIIGGAVLNGHVRNGQLIEIRPGYIMKKKVRKYGDALKTKKQPQWEAQPIRTTVKSLKYGKNSALYGYPGGNVGVQTNIDPCLTKSDRMCGHIVIDANNPCPPPIFNKFIMSCSFLWAKPKAWKKFEVIRVNIGSFKMKAEIVERGLADYNGILCVLEAPICGSIGDVVGICRQSKKKEWSFVGGGIIRKTKNIKIKSDQAKLDRLRVRLGRNAGVNRANEGEKIVDIGSTSMDGAVRGNKEAVHLNYQQRNGRKGVTTIVGLPMNVNFKKLMKKMKKKWSTGATIVEDKESGKVIQIQGDFRREIPEFVVKLGIVEKSQITIHGY